MEIDHVARARKAWPLLARHAMAKKDPMTYGELCSKLGLHHRAAQWFLGVIQTHCDKAGLPPLQALVVNKRSRLPGKGYTGSARDYAKHREAVKKVHSRQWSTSAPEFRT